MILVAQGSNEIQRIPKEEEKDPEYKLKEAERKMLQRQILKESPDIDKLIKQREQNKIRQAKYREKKKNLVLDSNTDHNSCPVKKRLTRAEHKKGRNAGEKLKQKVKLICQHRRREELESMIEIGKEC